MKKKWNLYNISESRGILLGVATLIVAFFHCFSYHFENITSNSFLIKLLYYLRNMGNIGVDIFLFLSAVGLYFSFSKDSNIKNFYKKRLLRILPSIIIVGTIYYIYKQVGFFVYLKNITFISFYTSGVRDLWYFALLILLYLLYPLLYKIIDLKGLKGLVSLMLIVVGSTILLFSITPILYKNIEIALTRIPVFLLGIYLGKKIKNKEEMPEVLMILFVLLFVLSNIILFSVSFKYYMCVRYIYCILGISIVFLISYLHSIVNFKITDKMLIFYGTYSMEVYLIFEKLAIEVRKLSFVHVHNNFLFYTSMFIITMALSFLLKKLCDLIINMKIWRRNEAK